KAFHFVIHQQAIYNRNLFISPKMKVSVLFCLVCVAIIALCFQESEARPRGRRIMCSSKRWHSSIGCQQISQLRQIRRDMRSNDKVTKMMITFLKRRIRHYRRRY
uniref:Uncharacterized protein n=1 Tax=Clytia hemisphaerica TaxID=252671 RepID=A0A7M5WKA7_9CNID